MTETVLLTPIILVQEKQTKNKLDETILEAVDESLTSFGESVRQVAYYQLDTIYHVRKQDIPHKIEEFANAVEEIFGVGARLIEMRILETLYSMCGKFVYFPEGNDLVFKDYMLNIRSYFQ